MALVPTCAPGNAGQAEPANTVVLGGVTSRTQPVPTCDGGWTYVEATELVGEAMTFHVSQLDPAVLGAAFAAGFITLGTGLLIVGSGRIVLSAIRSRG